MKKSTILTPYLILALFFGGVVTWWVIPTPGARTAMRVEQAILTLPVGSTKAQVAALIHKEALEKTSNYQKIDKEFLGHSAVDSSGYKVSSLGGFYGIRVPNTSKSMVGECFTMYYFFFDKQEKLLKTISESGCIGL